MRVRLFTVALALLVLVALAGDQLLPRAQDRGATFNLNRNAVWLDVDWVSEAKSEAAIASLGRDLLEKGFHDAYVYVNSVEPSGAPKHSTYLHAERFVRLARQAAPDLRLIAWVGVVNKARGHGLVDIARPEVRANIAAFARELTTDLGFDGVQLNVEPLSNGDESYLRLLEETRAAMETGKVLSIAGHKWAPDFVPFPGSYSSYWKTDYYRKVGSLVDQVAVMTYDSYSPHRVAYRLFVREQMNGVLRALKGTGAEVLVGLPTYEEPRANHNPEAENIEAGLAGVIDGLARLSPKDREPFAGVAIYAHWVTDEHEWETYQRLWLGD